jgi:ribosomal protein L37AE/L43A
MSWVEKTTHWKCDICGMTFKKETKNPLHELFEMPKDALFSSC